MTKMASSICMVNLLWQHRSGPTMVRVMACCPRAPGHNITMIIMTTMAAQITSLTVVYSTVNSDANQRKHQSPASLAFVWGIHRDRWIPRTKGQLRGKCFHLMTSSWPEPILTYHQCFAHHALALTPGSNNHKLPISRPLYDRVTHSVTYIL